MSKRVFIVAVPDEVEIQTTILDSNVIFSGVGKINATMAAYRAFNEGYSEVINVGSCGSLNLPVGEVVKVGKIFQDIDTTPLCEYGETPFQSASKQIIVDIKSPISCFTTDYFYDHKQIDKYSKNYLEMISKCSIFDMECFALAKVCKRFNIEFSSYKWISDGGDGGDWKENCKIGFKKIKQILNEKYDNSQQ
jgi:adenosylhomocysteine nucleosidase